LGREERGQPLRRSRRTATCRWLASSSRWRSPRSGPRPRSLASHFHTLEELVASPDELQHVDGIEVAARVASCSRTRRTAPRSALRRRRRDREARSDRGERPFRGENGRSPAR
jgi:hypothetical protein